ncbi:MAG: cupin domain-containing protein [Planctomycetales bacterium]|nr:cupin domain-containing protein [Planctomycetales bacterium]
MAVKVLILSKPNVRIERIVSNGHSSPGGFWYNQLQHEFVVLLQGAARLRFDDGEIKMKPGSFIDIPAHQRHRVEWSTPDEQTI